MIKMAKLPMRIYNKVLGNLSVLQSFSISDKTFHLLNREHADQRIAGTLQKVWGSTAVCTIQFTKIRLSRLFLIKSKRSSEEINTYNSKI
jgi:hypothetical protein